MSTSLDFQQIESRPPEEDDDSLADVLLYGWRLARDYYWIIGLAVGFSLVGAYVWTKNQTNIYRSTSKVVYHKTQGNIFGRNIEQVEMLNPGNRWEFELFWNTQKEVFKADWFARRVVRRVGLLDTATAPDSNSSTTGSTPRESESGTGNAGTSDNNSTPESTEEPASDPARRDESKKQQNRDKDTSEDASIECDRPDEPFVPYEDVRGETLSQQERLNRATSQVLNMSEVRLKQNSRVGVISVESPSRCLAAKISNAMAHEYVEYTAEFQSGGIDRLSSWFDEYVTTKREELESAQEKLQNFKRDKNILSFSYEDRQNLTTDSMTAVNERLVKVNSQLAEAEARLNQIQSLRKNEESTRSITTLTENGTLNKLFEKEAELEEEVAGLQTQYRSKHPKMSTVRSKLETVRKQIDAELDRLYAGAQNRVGLLEREKNKLNTQLDELKQKVFRLNELGVKYTQLKDRVENLKGLYDTVLKRSSELNINSQYQGNDIEVLESADLPESPVKPSLPLNLALGLLVGVGTAVGTTLVVDSLDETIKTQDDVESVSDRPVIAALPELDADVLDGLELIGESTIDTITHTAPKSPFAEGMKRLRTNLAFMAPDEPPETLLVTSSGPREGKTIICVNMSIAMAQSGLNTVVVGTDMRRPRLHKALGLENNRGVSNYVTSDDEVSSFVQSTVIDNLHVVTAGDLPPNPSELLHSDKFEEFVEALRRDFDRVIFDSPPLAAVSDPLILSQLVDGVLLVVKCGQSRMGMLDHSVDQLREIGAPMLGFILNDVPADRTGYGSYYGTYRYYGSSEKDSDDTSKLAS